MELGQHVIVFAAIGGLGICLWVLHPIVRQALIDGLRCTSRFPALWKIPVQFALAYGIFQWIAEAMIVWRIGEWSGKWILEGNWISSAAVSDDWIPAAAGALERTAALGNDLIIPFPLSAVLVVWALLFHRNVVSQLVRTAKRGFPRTGVLVIAILSFSALAGVLKPFVYLFLPECIGWLPMEGEAVVAGATAINVLAVIFEIFVGSYLTVYLMLTAFAWIRGINADRMRMHILAARRMRYVLKWTLVTTALALTLVVAPALLELPSVGSFMYLGILLALFPVQAVLVFHNDSLRGAIAASARVLREKSGASAFFLGGAWVCFFILGLLTDEMLMRIQGDSLILGVNMVAGAASAILSGWLLAAWVCLYRRLSSDRRPPVFSVT